MNDWCSTNSIDHQCTAPYMSAQNSCAKRLHCTILGHAHSMHLICNALASLWDKFYATAAYLANLTASLSLDGKTAYELWFRTMPSLTHLCEIGCHAFTLIQTNNPKIYRRSLPCILISYAPHSKAYRLWDSTSNSILNSSHITFIEHLDSQPVDLMPGTTVLFDTDAPPSWETPSPDQSLVPPRSSPSSTTSIPTSSPIIPIALPSSTPITPLPLPPHVPTPEIMPPPPPPPLTPLHRSQRIAALNNSQATTLLAKYSPLRSSHDLLPLSVSDSSLSPDFVLSAFADGSLEPEVDARDDPLWKDALQSFKHEYWIAGTKEEIQSLNDLQVFILVPRTSIPSGWQPM